MRVFLLLGSLILAGCASTPTPPVPVPEVPPVVAVEPVVEVAVDIPNHVNLARGSTISASSTSSEWEGEGPASTVADGDPNTRWASAASDPQTLTFDLTESRKVRKLRILWETASAAEFAIQLSDDGETWHTAAEQSAGQKGPRVDEIEFEPASGRWLRLNLRKRATEFAYSIYEVEIY
jgi:hypothetical protein